MKEDALISITSDGCRLTPSVLVFLLSVVFRPTPSEDAQKVSHTRRQGSDHKEDTRSEVVLVDVGIYSSKSTSD